MDRYRKLSHRLFKIPWIIGYYRRRKQMTIKNVQIFDYVIIPKITGEISTPIEFSLFDIPFSCYVEFKRVTFNATLDSLSPSKAAFNTENIRFLKSNDLVEPW